MARQFRLPDLGEGLTEAEIVEVLVHEGDVIQEDAPLLEVETDKAQVEIPSPMGGRVEKIHVAPGQTVQVGAVLVTFADASNGAQPERPPLRRDRRVGAEARSGARRQRRARTPREARGRSRPRRPRGGSRASSASTCGRCAPPAPADASPRRTCAPPPEQRPPRRPRTRGRHAARQYPHGPPPPRPHRPRPAPARHRPPAAPAKPLAASLAVPPLPRFEQWGPIERAPLSHLRRTIAERMTLSATLIPHVTHFDRADITDLDALIRSNLDVARGRGVTLTLTSFLLKAAALALAEHPQFNASLDAAAGELILKRYDHLGVAVATERGLIVPVIRDVDQKPLLELARELAALAQRVREGKATLEDLRGGTFTVTNIGALGGTGAIPIINYPEVAILGVARAREEPVVREGQIVPRLAAAAVADVRPPRGRRRRRRPLRGRSRAPARAPGPAPAGALRSRPW